MSKRLIRNLGFLNDLTKLSGKQQKLSILEASDDNIKALTEVVYNLLHGNIQIDENTKAELRKHKSVLRTLSDVEVSTKSKKKSLLKRKKLLIIILSPLLSIIGSCLGKLISSTLP